ERPQDAVIHQQSVPAPRVICGVVVPLDSRKDRDDADPNEVGVKKDDKQQTGTEDDVADSPIFERQAPVAEVVRELPELSQAARAEDGQKRGKVQKIGEKKRKGGVAAADIA